MPRYDYLCCGEVFEAYAPITERNKMLCPHCGKEAPMTFITPPYTQLASLDALFNYSQGYFDYGLGAHIRTRKQREMRMAELGVSPLLSEHTEDVASKPKPVGKTKVSVEDFKDAMEEGRAKLKQGWRPPTSKDVESVVKDIS